MTARKRGPKCGKCGGATYVRTFGSVPVQRITYCDGCGRTPTTCNCKTTYVGRHH